MAAGFTSSRTRTEETLRESEQRFRALASHAPVGIFMTNPQGDCVFVNACWCELAGMSPEQATGTGWTRALHPDDRERVATEWYSAAQFGRRFSSDYRFQRPDGRVAWLQGRAVELRSEAGALLGHLGTVSDVTEPKLAETALRDSEQRFRALADNIASHAWTCDRFGVVTWYNRRWYEYTGTTFEEMQGRDWKTLHHPDHIERLTPKVQHCLEYGEPWEETFPLLGKDGQYRWFLSRSVPIRDGQGNVTQWFGTNTDITDRLEMEETLRSADRKKDEFLATLAHELRNPLAPLRNGLEILKLAPHDHAASSRVQHMMERQLNQMVRLIDDLLDVSRISRGAIQLDRRRVDLADVLRDATETSLPLIQELGHELRLHSNAPAMLVDADATRLAQVFSNLLNNAAKYTAPKGHIELFVAREAGQAVIRVKDNGVGISREMLPRIFDMFTRVDKPSERSPGGLGIGLSIVRRLVEMHGGTVQAHSAGAGCGSELVVRLPLAEAATSPVTFDESSSAPASSARGRRFLVVDDNVDSAETLALWLELIHGDVRTAGDGLEALEVAEAFRPHVVLLDIGMPRVDGYEACVQVPEHESRPWVTRAANEA